MPPAIEIVPYTSEHEDAVRAFNGRLKAANLDPNQYSIRFPDSHIPKWLPKRDGCDLYQEFFVAIDDQSEVRGGYILKHQPFLVKGKLAELGTYQLPISEGIIDRRYAIVGARLYRDALRRLPCLLGLGGGGTETIIGEFLRAAGWQTTPISFWFRVVHINTFLGNLSAFRTTTLRRWVLDLLRFSGLGWLGLKAGLTVVDRFNRLGAVSYEVVPEFSEWADDVWNRCKGDYSLIAVRDQKNLNVLYPASNPRFIRLKIIKNLVPLGWAVLLNTPMSGHKHFGEMRVGTLVDCLAGPDDARYVVACAREYLEAAGSDLIISNQANTAWCHALQRNGFIQYASNFPFFSSPSLTSQLQPLEENAAKFHLNRADGDGPIHL